MILIDGWSSIKLIKNKIDFLSIYKAGREFNLQMKKFKNERRLFLLWKVKKVLWTPCKIYFTSKELFGKAFKEEKDNPKLNR